MPEVEKVAEAIVWLKSTEMPETEHERNTYYITLKDGDKKVIFKLHVHADKTIVAEPYVVHEYDYDHPDLYEEDEQEEDEGNYY